MVLSSLVLPLSVLRTGCWPTLTQGRTSTSRQKLPPLACTTVNTDQDLSEELISVASKASTLIPALSCLQVGVQPAGLPHLLSNILISILFTIMMRLKKLTIWIYPFYRQKFMDTTFSLTNSRLLVALYQYLVTSQKLLPGQQLTP